VGAAVLAGAAVLLGAAPLLLASAASLTRAAVLVGTAALASAAALAPRLLAGAAVQLGPEGGGVGRDVRGTLDLDGATAG
jgi:hypothetical protein